jgi:uncharacterized protein YoxC
MCKFIKISICIIVISLLIFVGITIWGKGGNKFRMFGDKAGGFIKRVTDKLADKADNLSEDVKKKFEELSGNKKRD